VITAPGPYRFTDVDDGAYYLMAAAFDDERPPQQQLLQHDILRASASDGPLVVRRGAVVTGGVDLHLRMPDVFDPPILTALLPLLADGGGVQPDPAIQEKTARPALPLNIRAATAALDTKRLFEGESPC
jgi:hypothetical protein